MNDRLRIERRAVVEPDTLVQLQCPPGSARVDAPPRRQTRHYLEVLTKAGEAFIHGVENIRGQAGGMIAGVHSKRRFQLHDRDAAHRNGSRAASQQAPD